MPWRRKSGGIEWGAPSQVTDRIGDDPIVGLASPRPDFDAAVTEFLIGLFSVALAPKDEAAWRKLWDAPPSPLDLEMALRRLPEAFFLDGDGPRAFQDLDALIESEPSGITAPPIDAPGDNTTKFNKDLFVKRSESPMFGRPAAAMALIALQTYAPAGGQGNRTSMRGGGSLTTLVEPWADVAGEPVWRLLWANAETGDQLYERDRDTSRAWAARDLYPWLAPTRTSNPNKAEPLSLLSTRSWPRPISRCRGAFVWISGWSPRSAP